MNSFIPPRRSEGTIQTTRIKQPWPDDKPFKILSIDGGGLKGILPASILAQLERRFLNGGKIIDHFDMITGTSTGGIIALGLSLGMAASDVAKIYIDHGKEIFPTGFRLVRKIRRLFVPKYDHRVLENRLRHVFENTNLNDAKIRTIIPSFEGKHGEPYIFKTPHHPDYKRDRHDSMVKIALATSAAPTYFRASDADGYRFVDGGLWANNPIMLAVVDALACYDIKREQIQILSLGCGETSFEVTNKRSAGGLWSWRSALEGAMRAESLNVLGQSYLLVGRDHVMRLDGPIVPKPINMDDYDRAKNELPELARTVVESVGHSIAEKFFSDVAVGYSPCPIG